MSHYNLDNKAQRAVNYDWLSVGASVGKLVNEWSLRNDLAVSLNDHTSIGAPACFNPALAEIEVDTTKAFGANVKASEVGTLTQRKNQLKFPVACGAIFHESLHARVSRWSLVKAHSELNAREYRFINAMEESRIEAWGVKYIPKNRSLLRACAIEIVMADLEEQSKNVSKVDAAAFLSLLTLARVDASVLDKSDVVDSVREILDTTLGEETIEKLRAIWKDFQNHDDHENALPLYDLTREFLKVLDERKEETGEESGEGEGGTQGEPGEPGSGKGKGEPTPEQIKDFKEFVEKVNKALKENAEEVQIANQSDLDDEIEAEENAEEVESRNNANKERNENKDVANQVFKNAGSTVTTSNTRSKLIDSRTPQGDELSAANKIASLLRKAKYRERSQTRVQSVTPPGRLRTRAVVQGAALKAQGVRTQVEAWRRTERKHNDQPTLNVGVMVDISGSMRPAMTPMAITAWVMSEATRRVDGKCAMVYYGQDVFATLKPGQRLPKVSTFSANDSTEEFDKAFKALDGALNLTHADGAKLLVVVSDGRYRPEQREYARDLLKKADKAGVAILWLTFDGMTENATAYLKGTAGTVVSLDSNESPTKASTVIGQAAAKALSAIGARV